ncbi:histidinol-phosphate transaminase [Candidatus Microgenomates bacterium]|nr:histidinol-phosphate transaminase [Candidatus Microgenomates bacterium]
MKLPKLYALGKKLPIDLSLSENPLGCSPRIFAALKSDLKLITNYPDPRSQKLKTALAQNFALSKENITFGNGSETLIDLVCRVLLKPGDNVLIPEVTFPLFETATILAGAQPSFTKMNRNLDIDLKMMIANINKKTKLIFLCNPNNPTGKILKDKEIINFVKKVSPLSMIVDEANIEFGGKSVVPALNQLNNLIVLRTFSKAFGLAGLRIGVLIAREKLIKAVDQIRQPFPLNAFAENAAIIALNDQKFIKKSRRLMIQEKEFLTRELKKRGFTVYDSQANNILVKVNRVSPVSKLFIQALSKNGVSVVNGSLFRGLDDRFFRLSPRLPKTNRRFLKITDKILEGGEFVCVKRSSHGKKLLIK